MELYVCLFVCSCLSAASWSFQGLLGCLTSTEKTYERDDEKEGQRTKKKQEIKGNEEEEKERKETRE